MPSPASSEMIYVLDDLRYWTEYLGQVFEDSEHFDRVRSARCPEKKAPLFDPEKHHTILTAGYTYEETHNNTIISRYLYSPGLNLYPAIEAYFQFIANHLTSDFHFLMLDTHYRILMTTDKLTEKYDEVRYQMLQDPRVTTTAVDPMAYTIQEAPKRKTRKEGTALLAPNWLIVNEDPSTLQNVLTTLSKQFTVTLVLHPLTAMMGGEKYIEAVRQMTGYQHLHIDLPREAMIDLYDEHTFVVTDGSGSAYEALLRGCEPLLINDLSCQKNNGPFHAALEEGWLPFPNYREGEGASFDREMFLQKLYPFLSRYTHAEAKALMHREILALT